MYLINIIFLFHYILISLSTAKKCSDPAR